MSYRDDTDKALERLYAAALHHSDYDVDDCKKDYRRVREDIALLWVDAAASDKRAEEAESELERVRNASVELGAWLNHADSEPGVCDEYKRDVQAWFDAWPEEWTAAESQEMSPADATIPP